jgi:hypothetical protein
MGTLQDLFGTEPFTSTDLYKKAMADPKLERMLACAMKDSILYGYGYVSPISIGKFLSRETRRSKGKLRCHRLQGISTYRIFPLESEAQPPMDRNGPPPGSQGGPTDTHMSN